MPKLDIDLELEEIVQTASATSYTTLMSPSKSSARTHSHNGTAGTHTPTGARPEYSRSSLLNYFTIHHRVGSVDYGTASFVAQNRAPLFFNPSLHNIVVALQQKSANAFVTQLATQAEPAAKLRNGSSNR